MEIKMNKSYIDTYVCMYVCIYIYKTFQLFSEKKQNFSLTCKSKEKNTHTHRMWKRIIILIQNCIHFHLVNKNIKTNIKINTSAPTFNIVKPYSSPGKLSVFFS